jgi:hypothetical protein
MPAEIALFGDPKLGNFSLWGWRRKSSRRGLGMGKIFHPPSPKNIKIIFINLYLDTL